MKLIKLLKDIISPKKCYFCKKEWHFLCPECFWKIKKYKSHCYVCKTYSDNFSIHKFCEKDAFFDKMIILTHYQHFVIKKLIKDSKYYHRKDILEDFWKYLWKLLLENENFENKIDYLIIPVPMYFFRKFSRWYNHSEILAKNIGKYTWIKVNTKLIKRVKNTGQQSKLSKKDRLTNLKNSFEINKKILDKLDKKIKIILIDDIISTWATINEISELLRKAWIRKIIGLCIASG